MIIVGVSVLLAVVFVATVFQGSVRDTDAFQREKSISIVREQAFLDSLASSPRITGSEGHVFDIHSLLPPTAEVMVPEFQGFVELVKPLVPDFENSNVRFERSRRSAALDSSALGPFLRSDPLFSRLYPDYYMTALEDLQEQMVRDAFFVDGDRFAFESEDDIFSFLDKAINYGEEVGVMSTERAQRFRAALNGEVRNLLEEERRGYMHSLSSAHTFFDLLVGAFAVEEAHAILSTRPGACFRVANPFSPVPGVNVPWPECCNCGLHCDPKGCVPIPDCAATGAAALLVCNVPLGCLNAVCPNGNAIWDSLTGICGCDYSGLPVGFP